VDTWRKSFRDGQDEGSNIKSTLTTTKNDEIQRLQELRKRTQTEVTDPVKRQELLDTIDASIRNLQI
jgi:transposase-like protein